MTIITHDTLFDFAELCRRDPAFIDGFKHNLKKTGLWELLGGASAVVKRDTPPPMAPLSSDITAVQTALFDNWPNGHPVKGTPNRYGFSIEIWDKPAEQIEAVKVRHMNYAFKSSVSLMPQRNLLGQIANLRKARLNPLSTVDAGYLDVLTDIAAMMEPNQSLGMLNTNIRSNDSEYERGQYYPAFQFVMVTIREGSVERAALVLSMEDIADPILLSEFVSTDWEGGRLGHKVKGQSRLDRVGFAPGWATN